MKEDMEMTKTANRKSANKTTEKQGTLLLSYQEAARCGC